MFVGLISIGSAAQRVASSPGAGFICRADSSGLVWARAAVGGNTSPTVIPSATPTAPIRPVGTRCTIVENSSRTRRGLDGRGNRTKGGNPGQRPGPSHCGGTPPERPAGRVVRTGRRGNSSQRSTIGKTAERNRADGGERFFR